ncbi:MAG: hypothetical protein OXC83_00700 [Chloroflexi bacterium]|nr:hypothetical protein [Chloroflexota bacterium]
MTTMAHTHEELATKKDVDARFDIVDERFDRLEEKLAESDYKHTQNYGQLSNSFVSMLNVMTSLTERVGKLEENQRVMIEILERIENSTSRGVGF